MKKIFCNILLIVTAFFMLEAVTIQAQTLVNNWGSTPRGANGWTILNTASTPDGNASMGGAAVPTGWMSIKGGFDSLTATTSQAFVITGTIEFVGGGGDNAYTWLRYALFNEDGALSNRNTDTAKWSETSNGNGYIFTPVSGSGTISNTYNTWPQGNQGTEWPLINSKSWNSTNSNGGGPFTTVLQAPYHQVATAGVYNWAISVQPLASGGNEVRWYLIQEHTAGSSNYYWWGGSFTDTSKLATFNSIGFSCNNDIQATRVNLGNVTVSLGAPITVPEAPFQPFYVNRWGSTPVGSAWPILNDSTYIDGDAAMGNGAAPTAWSSILGGFQEPVTATTDKAVVVTGKLEFVGGGGDNAYTWLRYALFNGNDTLHNQYTDSAKWVATTKGNGYIFTPVSGSGTISNTYHTWPQGNQGTEWPLINSGSWNSTNSNGGGPFTTVLQAPYHQVATAGVYDWAISVQPLASGGNEVRWYLIQEHTAGSSNYYWWGGSFTDTSKLATFNSIGFAVNNDLTATEVKLTDVLVNKGAPITVPEAPFQPFYVANWGFYNGKSGGWILTPGDVDGNVSISGNNPPTNFAELRGGFPLPVQIPTNNALLVTGEIELDGGGFEAANSLRLGLFYSDSSGTLSDTTWTGTDGYNTGYLFIPPSGTNSMLMWNGIPGSDGSVINGTWLNTNGTNDYVLSSTAQQPNDAVGNAGKYNFSFSVRSKANGSNEIRFLVEKDGYHYGGILNDNHSPVSTNKFNSIDFAINNSTTTALKLTNVYVNIGAPLDSSSVVAVEQNNSNLPTQFALDQNYPNPFNPTTTIQFALPKTSSVHLVVYNILGQVVANLADGNYNAGYYKINFDGSNLSSGIYFYSLKAGDFVSVKKLMLLK